MNEYIISEEILIELADAVRGKTELTSNLTLAQIVEEINNFQTGAVAETFVFTFKDNSVIEQNAILENLNNLNITQIFLSEKEIKNITKKTNGELVWGTLITKIALPTVTSSLTYTGSAQSPTIIGYDDTAMIQNGTISEINAGTYVITYTPKEGYCWEDESIETKSYSWTINKATIEVPSPKSLRYTGSVRSASWYNYDSTKMSYSGTKSATNVGIYTAKFTPLNNYMWEDGTNSTKSVTWEIDKGLCDQEVNGTVYSSIPTLYVYKNNVSTNGYAEFTIINKTEAKNKTIPSHIDELRLTRSSQHYNDTTYTNWTVTLYSSTSDTSVIRLIPNSQDVINQSGYMRISYTLVSDDPNYTDTSTGINIEYLS